MALVKVLVLYTINQMATVWLQQDKVYTGTMKLGEGTPSYDAESEVEERMPWEHITDEQIVEAASTFIGDIEQVMQTDLCVVFRDQPRKVLMVAFLEAITWLLR